MYKAHENEQTGEVHTVKQHSEDTARRCRTFSIASLKDIMYVMGLIHDVGKYQFSFQRRMEGAKIQVEHSACGAQIAKERYQPPLAALMGYCITGHHSGIPDGGSIHDTPEMSTLSGRRKRIFEDYSAYQKELVLPAIAEEALHQFLVQDCENNMDKLVDKFAFLTRYCFSCLTDADWLDTAEFCNGSQNRSLQSDFIICRDKVKETLSAFQCKTDLQKNRALLQKQVFAKVKQDAEIYLMNMPTGSGKTLCSILFALERALGRKKKKRIIYIIPYNSIIEQTAEIFEKMFGEAAEILRHQSTFSYDDSADLSEDCRLTIKLATENWDAQLIITTAVQFFESIYSNKRGKLRKLHNMADSILVFDEVHLMPRDYLQPCLQAISYITKYLGSEAVFLTATMPNFKKLIEQYALPSSKILDLIDDTALFDHFKKCSYRSLGRISDDALLLKADGAPASLIIVNKRTTAKRLYAGCTGQKYHLSTYMTALDRSRVISEIKEALRRLEEDYPDLQNVPDRRKITVISTSLIEAGVDLDFYTVFRELSGLDSVLQAGGRCNREGKRHDAEVFVFQLESEIGKRSFDERANITKGLLADFDDIASPECIAAYYDRLFFLKKDDIVKNAITQDCHDITSLPFKQYAQHFELIDSKTVSVVAAQNENCKKLVETLKATGFCNQRALQKYVFSVYHYELEALIAQHVVDDFGTGIWCLTNLDYYSAETGVVFEGKDYII